MEGEKILMSQRQLQRWHVMGLVEGGKITLKEAGDRDKVERANFRAQTQKGLCDGGIGFLGACP
jgi:hypothetical protein